MEINFCKGHGAPKGRAGNGGGLERGWPGLGFSAEVANQISLMKWVNDVETIGSEKKDIHVLFS